MVTELLRIAFEAGWVCAKAGKPEPTDLCDWYSDEEVKAWRQGHGMWETLGCQPLMVETNDIALIMGEMQTDLLNEGVDRKTVGLVMFTAIRKILKLTGSTL